MKLTPEQYAKALFEALSDTADKDHPLIIDRFAAVLAQNGDLEKYGLIEQEFLRLKLEDQGIRQAEVTLGKAQGISQDIVAELNRAVGGKVEIKTKVDEGLVGGVIVKVGDTLIDASVKNQLDKLSDQLKS